MPEVVVGILPRDDEDHVALQFPTTSVGVFAVTANSIGGAGMRCDGIGAGRSVSSYDIDDNDPDIYFGFGGTDVQMYRGRLVKDSTIRKLWKSTCELSVELHSVHQQLLERSGQA